MSNVWDLSEAREKASAKEDEGPDDAWCRRQALQLVAQLPDNKVMALAVLAWAERLVVFLSDGPSAAV